MERSPNLFIEDILASVGLIEQYLRNKTKDDFFKSVELQDKVIRRLEVIGEAIRNLSKTLKVSYPEIPWKKISGTRDVLIHEYFGVDLDITWIAATIDVHKLERQILAIKKDIEISR